MKIDSHVVKITISLIGSYNFATFNRFGDRVKAKTHIYEGTVGLQ